jgi:hypothetical protein
MYEETKTNVTTALQSSSTAVFTDDTIAKILALTTKTGDTTVRFDTVTPDANGNVTVAAGAEVVYIASSDTLKTTVTPPVNAPVVIFQGKGGVIASLNDGATTVKSAAGVVDRIVIGTAGADKIVIADGKNTQVNIGDKDTVTAGAGEDTIIAGNGNSTVQGGTGHAIVKLGGKEADYKVTVNNGHAVVTNASTASSVDISKIQFVQLDNGKALVFANDSTQAAVTTLYQTTFGHTADANGLKYWFDLAAKGATLAQIADGFANSAEYKALATTTNSDFVNGLYQHTFGRAADAGGLAYWTAALTTGGATRAQLAASFADIASHNIDGTVHTEAVVVGSVTIVHNII